MTDLVGHAGAASLDALAEREALAPEPRLREAIRAVLFARVSTIVATVVITVFVIVAAFAPWIAPYDPLAQSLLQINRPPSWEHWLGTDQFGRDVLSRMIHGSRNSLIFGLLSPLFAAIAGVILGVSAGYFGGVVDRVVSRLVDSLMAFPELLLAILIAAALGGSFWNIVVVLTVAFTPGFARVARTSTLAVKQEPYVESAVAAGVRTPLILVRHVVPNILTPIVVLRRSGRRAPSGSKPRSPSWGSARSRRTRLGATSSATG